MGSPLSRSSKARWVLGLISGGLGITLVMVASGASARGKTQNPPLLTCREVRNRVDIFFQNHYVFRSFDKELARRSYGKFFEALDPGKFYFLKSDLNRFIKYQDKIDEFVAKADCNFIDEIHNVFLTRVKERSAYADTLLNKPFQFNVAEEMSVGKQEWATDANQLDERWRKRIKFQVMTMKDPDGEPKARERLKRRYDQIRKSFDEMNSDEVNNLFVNAVSLSLDPHSTHLLPVEQEDFTIRMGNQLEGIGATLQEVDGYITVQALIAGGAAQRDGRLKAGDKIVAVDSGDGQGTVDLIDMELSKAVRLIRGKKGTRVVLQVLRNSDTGAAERVTIPITRDAVKIASAEAKSEAVELKGKKLGVVRLPSFYTDFNCRVRFLRECGGAALHVLRELKKMNDAKVEGVLLDLRNNGGGDLGESIQLTGLFIEEGPVVQTVDRRRSRRPLMDSDPAQQYAGPLVVLINKHSASASEIVSGALQDYRRAVVVGDSHTYGKATVQVVQEIPGTNGRQTNGALKITQQKFYRPSGKSNQEIGVQADIVIPSLLEASDVGEKENDYVLKNDAIHQSPGFRVTGRVDGYIAALAAASKDRISQSKEFAELKEKIEKSRKEKDRAALSLLEDAKSKAERIKNKEKEELELKEMRDENIVVRKSDIQMGEALNVLRDLVELSNQRGAAAGPQSSGSARP
ncbi:MAG: PDZ domain-containing protein [Proteobacteria bacterium]|nr:PDZ domain-containing protein [Pseudomonadota bacterium]